MRRDRVLTKNDRDRLRKVIECRPARSPAEEQCVRVIREYVAKLKPVDSTKVRSDVVTMNSRVCLRNLGNGKKKIVSLVYPDDSVKSEDKLSILSPLGSRVLGCTIGNVVNGCPFDDDYYLIEKILYQPEASGDFHL